MQREHFNYLWWHCLFKLIFLQSLTQARAFIRHARIYVTSVTLSSHIAATHSARAWLTKWKSWVIWVDGGAEDELESRLHLFDEAFLRLWERWTTSFQTMYFEPIWGPQITNHPWTTVHLDGQFKKDAFQAVGQWSAGSNQHCTAWPFFAMQNISGQANRKGRVSKIWQNNGHTHSSTED